MADADLFDALGIARGGAAPSPGPAAGQTNIYDALGIDPKAAAAAEAQGGPPDLPAWAGGGQTRTPPPAPKQRETLSNIGAAIPSGLYKGVAEIPNLPTNLANMGIAGVNRLTGGSIPQMGEPFQTNPTGYQPKGPIAENVGRGAEAMSNTAAMGALAGPALPFMRAGPGAVAGAGLGGAIQEPIAGQVPEPLQPLARIGANLGAGAMTGVGGAAAARTVFGGMTPESAQLARAARDTYGVPLNLGQISSNRKVGQLDSALRSIPFSGQEASSEASLQGWRRSVIRQMGEDADKLTPDVMQGAEDRIGQGLNDIENRNRININSPPLLNKFNTILNSAKDELHDPTELAAVQKHVNNIMNASANTGDISGTTFGNILHRGSALDRAIRGSNSNVKDYAIQIKKALQDQLELQNPQDAQDYSKLRGQWKAMETLSPLMQRADANGFTPSTGEFNPAQLRGVVNQSYGQRNLRTADIGDVPLHDLARIGQRFLKETPTSQTAERGRMFHGIADAGKILGGGAIAGGLEHLAPEYAAPAAGAALATPLIARAMGAPLRSQGAANRVINNSLQAQPSLGPTMAAAAGQNMAPLAAGSAMRQLQPPGPAINPQTGLPEFSLDANRASGKKQLVDQVTGHLMDGTLKTADDVTGYLKDNKAMLRPVLGGQGLQNVQYMSSVMRRGGNIFSVLSRGMPESLNIEMPELVSLAITNPALAQFLGMKSSRENLTKSGQLQLRAAVQKAQEGVGDGSNDAGPRGRNGGAGGGLGVANAAMGMVPSGAGGSVVQ